MIRLGLNAGVMRLDARRMGQFWSSLGPKVYGKRWKSFLSELLENVKKEASQDADLSQSVQKMEARLTDVKEHAAIKQAKETMTKARDAIMQSNEAVMQRVQAGATQVRATTAQAGAILNRAAEPVKKVGAAIIEHSPIDVEKLAQNKSVQQAAATIVKAQGAVLDEDESYRYGGVMNKERRDAFRQQRSQVSESVASSVEANPEAGTAVVAHRGAAWLAKWRAFKQDNILVRRLFDMKRSYDESDNVFVFYARSITRALGDSVGALFRDTERARVIQDIMRVDPTFRLEAFLKETREFIIPEILEAVLRADLVALQPWLSDALSSVLKAQRDAVQQARATIDGRIIDIRAVDLLTAKQLDDFPVLVISFHAQQTQCVRDFSGKLVDGDPDKVLHMFHVWALAKLPLEEILPNARHTNGWKLIEMASRPSDGAF
jgi:mitochondrial import inner membrane translocase subunit TIM44